MRKLGQHQFVRDPRSLSRIGESQTGVNALPHLLQQRLPNEKPTHLLGADLIRHYRHLPVLTLVVLTHARKCPKTTTLLQG